MHRWPLIMRSADGRERVVMIWDRMNCGHLWPSGRPRPLACPFCIGQREDLMRHWLLEHPDPECPDMDEVAGAA